MTKIKNTKKGMAKKTLSMSLVVAMLATSNVPVWAAEFSDGPDTAVTTEAAAPVVEDTDAFSDETAETPVVEDTDDVASALKAEGAYYPSEITKATSVDWKKNMFKADGKVATELVKGKIIDESTGVDVDPSKLSYVWKIDGTWATTTAQKFTSLSAITLPNMDSTSVGKSLQLCLVERKDTDGEPVVTIDFGAIKAVDVSNAMVTYGNFDFNGQERKELPMSISSVNSITLTAKDFDWSYSGTKGLIHGGSVVTAVGTVKAGNTKGITGTVKGTYNIVKNALDTNKVQISVKDKTKSYEYTGTNVQVPLEDVTITYNANGDFAGYDLSNYVKKVTTVDKNVGSTRLQVIFDTDKLANENSDFYYATKPVSVSVEGNTKLAPAKITALDLSECTVELSKSYQKAPNVNAIGKDIVVYKNGIALNLTAGTDYTVSYADDAKNYVNPQTYTGAVVITGTGKNVKGSTSGDLTITTGSFDTANFGESKIKLSGNANESLSNLTTAMEYTGEAPTYGTSVGNTKTALGAFYLDAAKKQILDDSLYDVTFENVNSISTQDHLAKVTVTGKSNYQGCKKVFYFKIVPAKVYVDSAKNSTKNSLVISDGVEENKAYTKAEEYKDAVGLSLTAKSVDPVDGKKYNSIALTEGSDYTVDSYSFTSDTKGTQWISTSPNKYVEVKATITNNNIVTDGVGWADGSINLVNKKFGKNVEITTKTATVNGKNVTTLTAYVKVIARSIKNADVTLEKTSYTYTGQEIIPNVTVNLGDQTLKKDKDYTVTSVNAKNAGTDAKVVINGIGEYSGSVEIPFTIEKANVADLTLTLSNTANHTYTGKQIAPNFNNEISLKLGNNVIAPTEFDSKEYTYGENINAGEKAGTLTITATEKNKNFSGSATLTFAINPAVISGTPDKSVQIYNEYGKKLDNKNLGSLAWTGKEVKFAKAEADLKKLTKPSSVDASIKLTTSDVEVVYVNNVDKTTLSSNAYIALVGKGNYTGKSAIVVDKTGSVMLVSDATTDVFKKAVKDGTYTILQAGIIENSVNKFNISGSVFSAKDITVADGVYAGGKIVNPVVTVKHNGVVLTEGTDYKVTVDSKADVVNASETPIKLSVTGLGKYKGVSVDKNVDGKDLTYKIAKKDLKDCSVSVNKDNKLTVMNGNVVEEKENFDVKDNGDGTVTVSVVDGGKNYTGSVTIDKESTKVGTPIISSVSVVGNKATVILSDEVDVASGYDYVISTDKDCITSKNYTAVNKNQAKTSTAFKYVNQGTYYAYCHAWTRDANGKKVFGEWSKGYEFSVTATTPDAPVIKSVKVSGSTVKVTYELSANATGYDVVLGTSAKKDNGELRPYNYGAHKVLNLKESTVTATFKNVPAGTWTVGMHAFNRTSIDGKKVFSPWSNLKTAKVK